MAVHVPFRLRELAWLVSASLAATGTAAAAPAARVDFTIGGVTVTGADGRSRPAAKGLELQSGDRIVTAEGRAQLRFTDGAYVSLQPNTDFTIREYRFDGKTDGTEKGIFGLVRGALRTVTGAIGRVNRGAYQIQTPTATIGIRGTGGLIQILPDGSTLVTGNSGVWSVGNQKASVDVPAGKAVKAGLDQTVPPMEVPDGPVLPPPTPLEVKLVQAWDNLPGAVPGQALTTSIAGDNVTSSGLPASLMGPLNCGTAAGCELAYATLVSGSGTSTQFHANPGQATLAGDGAMIAFNDGSSTKALTGMSVDTGSADGVVSWGRWIGGATIDGSPWSGFQSLAYVVGLPSPIADITSMSGSFTFNLIGWTAPTDGVNLGTVTGGAAGRDVRPVADRQHQQLRVHGRRERVQHDVDRDSAQHGRPVRTVLVRLRAGVRAAGGLRERLQRAGERPFHGRGGDPRRVRVQRRELRGVTDRRRRRVQALTAAFRGRACRAPTRFSARPEPSCNAASSPPRLRRSRRLAVTFPPRPKRTSSAAPAATRSGDSTRRCGRSIGR
jgi:hypothetical protein